MRKESGVIMIYLIFLILFIVLSVVYFNKHPFVSTGDYSMKFHSFFLRYFIPAEMAIHFADAIVEISNGKIVAFVFQFTLGALFSLLFVKLSKLEKSSYKLIIGLTVVNYGLNLLATIFWVNNNHPNFDIGNVIGSFIWFGFSIYCSLYYYQRKSIFSAKKAALEIENPQTIVRIEDTSNKQICFCRKCGASIPSDSVFCPCCGEKI